MVIALIATAIGTVAVLWAVTTGKPKHRMADYEPVPIPAEVAQRMEWTEYANG